MFLNTYIQISKCKKQWKQSSAIKQLLETLFLAIKMCTGIYIYIDTYIDIDIDIDIDI